MRKAGLYRELGFGKCNPATYGPVVDVCGAPLRLHFDGPGLCGGFSGEPLRFNVSVELPRAVMQASACSHFHDYQTARRLRRYTVWFSWNGPP